MSYVVVDLESDGLLREASQVHCMVTLTSSGVRNFWYDGPRLPIGYSGPIASGMEYLQSMVYNDGYVMVGHHIAGFDLPLLKKLGLVPGNFNPIDSPECFKDTLQIDCLLNPESPHGLGYHGERLGVAKPAHEDWSVLTNDMLHRCSEDVTINDMLFREQCKTIEHTTDFNDAIVLEQQVAWIHAHQTLNGVRVDILKAANTLMDIDREADELEESLQDRLGMTVTPGSTVEKPFVLSGGLSVRAREWFTKVDIVPFTNTTAPMSDFPLRDPTKAVRIMGPYSKVEFHPVNLNSHPKVKELLLGLGWKPKEWNRKRDDFGTWVNTSPKLTEDSYGSLPDGLGQDIARLLMLRHRRRFILNEKDTTKGLLSFVREDGRVPADGMTCGTNTSRYRHKGALVNLPRPSTILGQELRELFCVPDDRLMVGIDLSGIEARMMGHYAHFYDGGDYAKIVLEGDVHTTNALLLHVDRDTAKSFLYAISYGAGVGKLAEVLGTTQPRARKLIKAYWTEHHGLAKLIEALEAEYHSKGYILGLDGRRLYIRSAHKLLNTLIQNAATIVFKRWMVKCFQHTRTYARNLKQIIAYHDELEWESPYPRDITEAYAKALVSLIRNVGEELKLNVPLDGDYKIGKNYSEVH